MKLLQFDQEAMKIQRITTAYDGVGDISAIQTIINDQRRLLVSVTLHPTLLCIN